VKMLSAVQAYNLINIRIHAEDARDVLRWLPDAALSRVFILFPDPWPKKRHHKRRLVSPPLMASLARVIRSGGELRIATDIGDYARTALASVYGMSEFAWLAERPADWRERPEDWPQTRYEQKALSAGRRCCFLRFRRR
jgi:tRNA (guanine-N7-)-methyltransferase